MKVLVVGSGGREHALVETLAASPLEPEMYAAPGNVGISRIAETVDIPVDDLVSLRDYASENEIDLTVVGPEAPLIGGIDRKSTRLNSSHANISYAVFCLKKKKYFTI